MPSHTEQWLLQVGAHVASFADLLAGMCARLDSHGFELLRVNVQVRTQHPEVYVQLFIWRPEAAAAEMANAGLVLSEKSHLQRSGMVQEVSIARGMLASDMYLRSPVAQLYAGAPRVRCRIAPDATTFPYPIVADLHAQKATDYLALPMRLGDGPTSAFTLATRKAGGFTDADLAELDDLLPALTLVVALHSTRHACRTLLHTYLGRTPGELVLSGHILRGDVQRLEAAIWFSDLRGFTELNEKQVPEDMIVWLNEYFGAIAEPIQQHGGEILKFIGDAVLAVFPVTDERSRAQVCEHAVAAARQAHEALAALNLTRADRSQPLLAHGIGLHVGAVQFGNIGADRRLDFTVIGQAVNLASRIESLCGKLQRRTLASAELAGLVGEGLEAVGVFPLKGIAEPQQVYGLAGETA